MAVFRNEYMTRKLRIAVAMSGGVDSSVAAALLAKEGHEVIGITLRLYEPEISPLKPDSSIYANEASKVAEKLGIKHHIIDMRERFEEAVIKPFANSYAHGETPNPCAVCNKSIKFGDLLEVVREIGAEALATGHYARIVSGSEGAELHTAFDGARDQSYFLFAVPREKLAFLRFPLGEMNKNQVRTLACEFGLPVATRPDSQDICFVPEGDYARIVCRFHPEAFLAGEIVDLQGNVLGCHEGIANFTIGQRRGLNISNRFGENNEPLFVIRLEPETRRVIVGPHEALAKTEVFLSEINWFGEDVPDGGIEVMARLRSSQPLTPARFFRLSGNRGRIIFNVPVYGVAKGQAGVVYRNSRVLGGGWIC